MEGGGAGGKGGGSPDLRYNVIYKVTIGSSDWLSFLYISNYVTSRLLRLRHDVTFYFAKVGRGSCKN